MRPGWVIAVACGLALTACRREPAAKAEPADPAPGFWVWHRSSALSPGERERLPEGGRIYRQVAEFGYRGDKWDARTIAPAAALASGDIPVVRLDPGPVMMERPDAPAMLARWLRHHFDGKAPQSLQLDYDCPVRLLPRYAAFLRELRTELPEIRELSVTALAGWIDSPGVARVGEVADELVPMFYDLVADKPGDVVAGRLRPIGGADSRAWITRWKSRQLNWRAGLANLERLTLYRADGSQVGHLRSWSPEMLGRTDLLEAGTRSDGIARFRVKRDGVLHGTAVKTGDHLIWRAPAEADFRDLPDFAEASGARGIVWFALPGPGLRASRSATHVAAARHGTPLADVRVTAGKDGRVTLRNIGPGDVIQAPGEAPHRLSLRSEEPGIFGREDAGNFTMTPGKIPPEFSREIVLTFPRLLVGEEISTAPGWMSAEDAPDCRWSLDDSPFLPLSPSP